MKRYAIVFLFTLFLLPSAVSAQGGMDIVEIDIDSNVLYFLYHYEPKFSKDFGVMGQIFGSHSFDEMGYTIGIYYSTPSFLIEFPVGVLYSTNSPIQLTNIKTKVNWFAGIPKFGKEAKWEITSINDAAWGVRGFPTKIFNKLEVIYTPVVDAGLRFQSFNVEEPFAPYLGVAKRVKVGNVHFFVFQGKNLKYGDWKIELNVLFWRFRE